MMEHTAIVTKSNETTPLVGQRDRLASQLDARSFDSDELLRSDVVCCGLIEVGYKAARAKDGSALVWLNCVHAV
ncbi:hypothetical protein D3C71_824220 [compost metagenome]